MQPGARRLLALSPDGRTLAVATADQLVLIDAQVRGEARVFPFLGNALNPPRGIAFSADGRLVAVAGGSDIMALGTAGWLTVHPVEGRGRVDVTVPSTAACVTFLGGTRLALGGVRYLVLADTASEVKYRLATSVSEPTFGEAPDHVVDLHLVGATLWTAATRAFLPWRVPAEGAPPSPGTSRRGEGPEITTIRATLDGALVLVSTRDPASVEVWAGELP